MQPRAGARRLGLAARAQMIDALVRAIERPPDPGSSQWVVEVPQIRSSGRVPNVARHPGL